VTISFRAVDVKVEVSESHVLMGLGSGGSRAEHHVIMMRALADAPAASDVLSGEAYLEYRNAATSGYGCVVRATLTPGKLLLVLDRRRCPQFPDAELEVTFEPDQSISRDVSRALEKLVDGPRLTIVNET
jgi:hypothetical protein